MNRLAATKIQSIYRGRQARRERKKQVQAATRIQSSFRGKLSRQEVTAYMQSGHHLLTKAGKAEAIKGIKADMKKEFGDLDKDGDGFLDATEMKGSDDGTGPS